MKSLEQRQKEAEYVTEFLKSWNKHPKQEVDAWNFTKWTEHKGYKADKHGLGRY